MGLNGITGTEKMSEHVPAWKKIQIKKSENSKVDDELDSLIVSTHLSTGSLSKKEKKRIIRGQEKTETNGKVQKKSKTKANGNKREKLAKEERMKKREAVLKDQLRYLIEFYTSKCRLELPEDVSELPSVKEHIGSKMPEDENGVQNVWKFSKQKQNWLIKHFMVLEEIPAAYDLLLITYFQELKGGAKEQMVEQCMQAIKKQNEYLEKQKEEMARIVLGEDKEKEASQNVTTEAEGKKQVGSNAEAPAEEKEEPVLIPPSKELLQRATKMLDAWKVDYTLQ